MKLNITLPVLNEERQLPCAVAELTTFLRANIDGLFEVVIVDNGSTDGTWAVGNAWRRGIRKCGRCAWPSGAGIQSHEIAAKFI